MEFWDIYDRDRNKTFRVIERGKPMSDDEYHLVVYAWIRNPRGEWLISRRSPDKSHPLMWETTGGCVVAAEDSPFSVLREVREELGLTLEPGGGRLLYSERHDRPEWKMASFSDIWLFEYDCPIEAVVLQECETCGAMWAGRDKIREMLDAGKFLRETDRFPPFEPEFN